MPKLVRVFLDNTLESGLDLLATWLTSETLLKVKLFSLRIMVYMETQTVQVLRANQKNIAATYTPMVYIPPPVTGTMLLAPTALQIYSCRLLSSI